MHFFSEANQSLYTAKEIWGFLFLFSKFIFKFLEKEWEVIFMKEGVHYVMLRGLQIACTCASKYFCIILKINTVAHISQARTSVLAGFGLKLSVSHHALSHFFLCEAQSSELISTKLQGGLGAKKVQFHRGTSPKIYMEVNVCGFNYYLLLGNYPDLHWEINT